MTISASLLLAAIAFLAFVVKGVTGFGPAIVVISLGSLLVAPQTIIPVSAGLDMIAGAILLGMEWRKGGLTFWLPLAGTMVVASVLGAVLLKIIPPEPFRILLSIAIFALALWFLLRRLKVDEAALQRSLPRRPVLSDFALTGTGGLLGGLLGISGPPIIWHFGRKLAKQPFRQTLVPVFLAGSVARVLAYWSVGLVDATVLKYAVICLPGLLLGILVGNRIFVRISERYFAVAIGVVLMAVAVRLVF